MSNLKNSLHKTLRITTLSKVIVLLLACITIASCASKQAEPEPVIAPAPQIEPTLSSLPLDDLSLVDYKFAQAALDQLGYKVLFIDGIWGPRSAAAIQQFEQDNQLISANGRLSELNLTRLSDATTLTRAEIESATPGPTQATDQTTGQTTGIAEKLDPNVALSISPQLIITDLSYNILAKPNPYSETVTQLPQGAGLYIINLQEGWYQVETLERQRGYIQD